MKRKYNFMIGLMVVICLSTHAVWAQKQVSVVEAKNAAVNFMNKRTDNKDYSLKQIVRVNTDSYNNSTLLYEVMFEDGQTVLLSGSKSTLPVLGLYKSNNSIFDIDNIPGGLKVFLNEYRAQILYTLKSDTIPMSYAEEWTSLQQPASKRGICSYVVNPLLSSQWGQDESNDINVHTHHTYNYYVSETGSACFPYYYCPAGCVAVAMAQIMYYWKYPVYNPSIISQYDWCNMEDQLFHDNNPNFTAQRNAVARLIRDCGLQVNMNYCSDDMCQSSAYSSDVRDVMVDFFKYSDNAFYVTKNQSVIYANSWPIILKYYLDLGMPIYYRAHDPEEGGHAFVCDGYTSNNLFHFNWGWNGDHDGDFVITNLNPSYSFTQDHAAIFNLHPNLNHDVCNFTLPLEAHYLTYYNVYGNTTPEPYNNVPYTLTYLQSASNASNIPVSWRTIPSGATTEYRAHKEVLLRDGFYAAEGCDFYAHIVPCGLCDDNSENLLSSEMNSEDTSISPAVKSLQQQVATPSGVSVYPNPVTGTLHIALLNPEESVKQVFVTNLLGNVVLQQDNLPEGTINTTPLATGMYIARICTVDGKTYHAKFVKK